MNLKNYLKRTATLLLSACMVLTIPLQAFAYSADLILLSNKSDSINTLAVTPYKLNDTENVSEFLNERNAKDLINFNDVNENMWSYDDIICASNTFLYQGNFIKAHLNKDNKNSFNIDTSEFEIKQKKFQRMPR